MSLHSLLQTQFKADYRRVWFLLISIFFIAWLALSFIIPLSLNHWRFFFDTFVDYLIYFHVISTLGFVYLLTGGHLSEAKKHLRLITVFTAVLVVLAFTYFRWTTLTTSYGSYGYYSEPASVAGPSSYLTYGEGSRVEKETIYREAMKFKYDTAFQQIWIFGGFIFASTFLILMALDKKENGDKQL